MKVAMFPGQGISAPLVSDALAHGGKVVERSEELLGIPLRRDVAQTARRSKAVLPTRLAQPAIVVASLALWEERQDKASFSMLTGHSLGQISALAAGSAVSLRGALRLVAARADAMERAAMSHPGGMVALIDVDLETAETIAKASGACIANDNAPGQIVLSGRDEALAEAAAITRSAGGRSIRLQVSGPFHSRAMADATRTFEDVVMTTEIRSPLIPLISDMTARPMTAPGEIRRRLVEQLTGRVRWRETVDAAIADGATEFVDIGPGVVLRGLVDRCTATGRSSGQPTLAEAGAAHGD